MLRRGAAAAADDIDEPVVEPFTDLGGGFSFTETETGGGILLGLGYDARIGRNLSLVPFLNLLGANFDGTRTDFVQLGLGLTFH